jgi:Schlafen, AlbA_2
MDSIKAAIDRGELPSDRSELLRSLLEDDGKYISQEGPVWDFKRQWPFSYSDDYFAGIVRLICAFANTHGGIIVFGVHDEVRTAGHNKVTPNMDRLQQSLTQILSELPEMACRRYDQSKPTAVDVLLVRSLRSEMLPTRFTKASGKYGAGVIWVRQGHEVIPAEPRHVATLYCRSSEDGGDPEIGNLSGGLPPSAATIKRFVGRINTIDKIFRWLKLSDEPRTFLYGKGGSGKTTIAYEVAKVLKYDGSRTKVYGDEMLDHVLFVTAKQQTLDVLKQTPVPFVGLDFSNERELYEALLTLTSWTTEPLADMSLEKLKREITALFDLTSNFIVIDDIDTLTTKGQEAGFDFLYGVLWKAKRRSKILYTIRNVPTQSLSNSIEVPGLENGDYDEFVRVCAEQFRVQPPEQELVGGRLSVISERRPLVIESIVALKRTAGSYNTAINLFEEGAGEDVRAYVFNREWSSLPANNYARYVLAVLALHGEALAFADIVALTHYEESRVKDAVAELREMFLQVNEVGAETTFQLGALTRAFVVEQSKKLDHYAVLKERVEKYKRNFYPENPLLSRLRDKIEGLLARGYRLSDPEAVKQAYSLVTDRTLSPKISEDPRFLSLQAYVCVCQSPPKIEEARRSFGHAMMMKFEPDMEHLKKWFWIERNSGYGTDGCLKIADFVSNGKRYDDDDKMWFLSRKASLLYNRGREEIYFSPERGSKDLEKALELHLSCFHRNYDAGSILTDKSEEYARNTAYFLFNFLIQNGQYDEYFRIANGLAGEGQDIKLDPLEGPLSEAVLAIERSRGARGELNRLKGRVEYLGKLLNSPRNWYDRLAGQRLGALYKNGADSIDRQLSPRK